MEEWKLEDEIKNVLKLSISSAFDKWGSQYYRKRIDKKGRLTKKLLEEAKQEDLFLSKRVFVLGFARHVTKKALKNPDLTKQKKVILRTILQSIIYEHGFTVKELEKNAKSNDLYTRRHTQRIIHESYSEAFIGLDKQHKDERLSSFSTVFSPHVESSEDGLPPELLAAFNTIPMTPRNIEWVKKNARIRTITPEYLDELIKFRDEAIHIMHEIGYQTETGRVLYDELSKVSEIQQIFHNHLQSIIAVGWWRGRRDTTKRRLIDDGFPWKYTAKDAENARELLIEITNSEDHAFGVICDSGMALVEMNLHDSAEIVFKECIKFEKGSPVMKGIVHENLAVYHRKNERPKLMIREMKKAVNWFRKSGDNYRISVGLKNLGEAVWMYGYDEAALRYYKEAEKYADSLEQEEKAGALWNIAFSARRIKNIQMEIEYLTKCLISCPEDWTDRILAIEQRLNVIS